MVDFSIGWQQFGAGIAAVGSLGLAAFGIVESLGKAFVITLSHGKERRPVRLGLPYVGLGVVLRMIKPLQPALRCAYGEGYGEIIAQQYRADRSQGSAPDTIRQGVRLGLPFLSQTAATKVVDAIWGLTTPNAEALAAALTAGPAAVAAAASAPAGPAPTPPAPAAQPGLTAQQQQAQALAARFSTALDTRVQAAFAVAEQVYQARAQFWAGLVAIGLSLAYQGEASGWAAPTSTAQLERWMAALIVGLVAVPLAPVAKDLSSSLSDALSALGKLRGVVK